MSDKQQSTKGYLIPLRLVTQAAQQGIPLAKLQDMLRRSARVTHPEGNRRYHELVFLVEGNRVLSFSRMEEEVEEPVLEEEDLNALYNCDTCKDVKKIQVFNECPYCEGEGCKRCDDGLVPGHIPCPECTRQKPLHKRKKRYY